MKYQVSRVVAGPLLHLLWRPQVTGAEHIPRAGGAIIASNHLSFVDSIFLPLVIDRPLTFAAKSEYFAVRRPSSSAPTCAPPGSSGWTGKERERPRTCWTPRLACSGRGSCSASTRRAP